MAPSSAHRESSHRLAFRSLLLIAVVTATGACGSGEERPSQQVTSRTTAPATTRAADASALVPRGAGERVDQRRRMVEQQISNPRDGRDPITDRRVLDAMLAVPRHAFVPAAVRDDAYADSPLPIGHGQTISQPYIVALMTEHLRLPVGGKVLEVGSGSGYQAAVLAHLTPHVYTIEIVEDLARMAQDNLKGQGYEAVQARAGDGYGGWPEHAPFDGIIVTCAPDQLPPALWEQLRPGGRIVIPIGPADRIQRLVVISKTSDGQRRTQHITEVRFVPMTGNAGAGKGPC
jgi:protein-L-isoaspartate(D-aspartate) O-methyltransferase